uniref:2-amino-3-carboxymuconate-6-semialdehyde decarboxylase n=1 Tax=Amphimedon queenslandica TaxID=400682 RepID=A0A1X7VQI3_AMPQE
MFTDEGCALTPSTQELLRQRVFNDLDPREVVDYHCHLVGHGDSGSQCYMHHSLKSWWNPLRRIKSAIFMGAAQVTSMEGGDIQFISRLLRLARHFVPISCTNINGSDLVVGGAVGVVSAGSSDERFVHGKLCLLPFDKFVDPLTGEEDEQRTTFSVPNEYSLMLSREYPDLFIAFGSVNPYRSDAIQRLQHLSELGVNVIKWLPNSMGIDPSDERIEPFYNKMKELNMILLVHCGEEHSVNAAYINNEYGNPLLLRRPLNCGVKIITAHCASEGRGVDIDRGDGSYETCFDLWLRLMREDRYKGLLYGDISAICAVLRVRYLHRLIQETDIHDRLVYGSDYPVPAINVVVHTSRLVRFGLITDEEKGSLDEFKTALWEQGQGQQERRQREILLHLVRIDCLWLRTSLALTVMEW